jgi:hypothetical protein
MKKTRMSSAIQIVNLTKFYGKHLSIQNLNLEVKKWEIIGYSTLSSTIWLDPRKSLTVAGLITAILFILNLIDPFLNQIDFIQKASPFYYFKPATIMNEGFADWIPFTIWFLIAMALLFAALIKFDRRDLT